MAYPLEALGLGDVDVTVFNLVNLHEQAVKHLHLRRCIDDERAHIVHHHLGVVLLNFTNDDGAIDAGVDILRPACLFIRTRQVFEHIWGPRVVLGADVGARTAFLQAAAVAALKVGDGTEILLVIDAVDFALVRHCLDVCVSFI